ncbi:magnesium transporter [Shewanella sp. Scap07]|uniref:magnesium transporter n=1 Tax=Shewanella sp. Scap07 TaxID=2589987 RepID=UPI0015C048CB|nr:magnesium transporter [Shewanella sp. Scap07]QLE84496.1 magnesium transporter [Shewanella sp. Scap07]
MTRLAPALHSEQAVALHHALLTAIEQANHTTIVELASHADSVNLALVLRRLEEIDTIQLWRLLNQDESQTATHLFNHLTTEQQVALIQGLPFSIAGNLFHDLRSVDRRKLLLLLPKTLRKQLLQTLPQATQTEQHASLAYHSHFAGGICNNDIIKVSGLSQVSELQQQLQNQGLFTEKLEWRYVYLYDQYGNYLGAVKIHDLLLLAPEDILVDHIDPSIVSIDPQLDLQTLSHELDNSVHPTLPVVDSNGLQIGVVGRNQLNQALLEQSQQQLLENSGVLGGDEFRHMPTFSRNLRRLAFLLPSVVLSYAAISIITNFESLIEQIALLAAILPLVANLSGAAGNQAVAVSIRELSTGHISYKDLLFVAAKELPIGAINGVILGTIMAMLLVFTQQQLDIGLPIIVALAYTISSTLAAVIGGCLPLILKGLRLDPAMLSSPILTTVTDAIAFFSVLILCQMFLL